MSLVITFKGFFFKKRAISNAFHLHTHFCHLIWVFSYHPPVLLPSLARTCFKSLSAAVLGSDVRPQAGTLLSAMSPWSPWMPSFLHVVSLHRLAASFLSSFTEPEPLISLSNVHPGTFHQLALWLCLQEALFLTLFDNRVGSQHPLAPIFYASSVTGPPAPGLSSPSSLLKHEA